MGADGGCGGAEVWGPSAGSIAQLTLGFEELGSSTMGSSPRDRFTPRPSELSRLLTLPPPPTLPPDNLLSLSLSRSRSRSLSRSRSRSRSCSLSRSSSSLSSSGTGTGPKAPWGIGTGPIGSGIGVSIVATGRFRTRMSFRIRILMP